MAGWFTKGRAFAKAKLAGYAPKADEIPYDQRLLAWLRQEKARGRRLALATATDRKIADDIAAHVGVFDDVFASDGVTNLKSARKGEALSAAYPEGFVCRQRDCRSEGLGEGEGRGRQRRRDAATSRGRADDG